MDSQMEPGMISVEGARAALVELVEHCDIPQLKMSLHVLKTSEAQEDGQGNLAFGPWVINLKLRRFDVCITGEDLFEEYGGVFTKNAGNEWTATIDLERRT